MLHAEKRKGPGDEARRSCHVSEVQQLVHVVPQTNQIWVGFLPRCMFAGLGTIVTTT